VGPGLDHPLVEGGAVGEGVAADADIEDLLSLASVAKHRDAETSFAPREEIGPASLPPASVGGLMVLDTPLSVCCWNAAWCRTCQLQWISWAVLNRARVVGTGMPWRAAPRLFHEGIR
jgi:hypothetical protein